MKVLNAVAPCRFVVNYRGGRGAVCGSSLLMTQRGLLPEQKDYAAVSPDECAQGCVGCEIYLCGLIIE